MAPVRSFEISGYRVGQGEDLLLIAGDVTLRTGREGEHYAGIRKGPVNLSGRLGLFDEQGPFGSPTSDSARTCTSSDTGAILAVIMATANYGRVDMGRNIGTFSDHFASFCGGQEIFRAVLGGIV